MESLRGYIPCCFTCYPDEETTSLNNQQDELSKSTREEGNSVPYPEPLISLFTSARNSFNDSTKGIINTPQFLTLLSEEDTNLSGNDKIWYNGSSKMPVEDFNAELEKLKMERQQPIPSSSYFNDKEFYAIQPSSSSLGQFDSLASPDFYQTSLFHQRFSQTAVDKILQQERSPLTGNGKTVVKQISSQMCRLC